MGGDNLANFMIANPLGKDTGNFNVSLLFQKVSSEDPNNPPTYQFNMVKVIKLEADLPEEVDYVAL